MRRGVAMLHIVVALVGGSVPASAPLAAQEAVYLQGNQLYQDGRFEEAVEAYRAVLSAGVESAVLRYNLGNAWFKAGELGPAILSWERALALDPGLDDARSNLALARSLTVDAVEPLPTFWLVRAWHRWVGLLPRGVLLGGLALGWTVLWGGVIGRILARGASLRRVSTAAVLAGGATVLVLGVNVAVREFGVGQERRGVILAEEVPVRSAPSEDDNLTLFEIHEGTVVRIDQRTDTWAEIVLEDGKVGWVPGGVLEEV